MTKRERPPAVTRHLRSPLWLPFATVAVFATFFFVEDLPASRPERLEPHEEVAVTGQVLKRAAGGALKVRYFHPVTEQRVTSEVYVWDRRLVPDPGGSIRLVAERDDPLAVAAEGDVMPLSTNLVVYAAWVVGAALPVATRRFSVWRSERLVAAHEASFAMVAALAPRRRRRSRCDLHLYPLDAAAGAPPVCSVPLLTTAQAPIGKRVFPVEVKGSPRPLGRVVARSAGGVLWPAGRASRASGRADHPRPPGAPRPVERLAAAPGPPSAARPSRWLSAVRGEMAAFAAAVALLVVVAAVTAVHARDARRVRVENRVVVGEVVAHEGNDDVVVLRYHRDGVTRTTRAPADFASEYRKGIRYPAWLDPEAPTRARLLAEPYDATEPVAWAATPVAGAAGLLWARWRSWRRNRRAARDGPWWHASARRGEGQRDVVVTNGAGDPVCAAVVAEGGSSITRPTPVVVAGPAEPGSPIAVWRPDGHPLTIVGAATNATDAAASPEDLSDTSAA